eukprot:1247694-Rhodomonas_salina.2
MNDDLITETYDLLKDRSGEDKVKILRGQNLSMQMDLPTWCARLPSAPTHGTSAPTTFSLDTCPGRARGALTAGCARGLQETAAGQAFEQRVRLNLPGSAEQGGGGGAAGPPAGADAAHDGRRDRR